MNLLQLPVRGHFDVPSYGEIQSTLGCLKCCKAAGVSGILPELLMSGDPVFGDKLQLVELFALVRRDGCVVIIRDWYNALIVPVPKKGNLKLCDNWRGASLLNIYGGKVLGRIIQDSYIIG